MVPKKGQIWRLGELLTQFRHQNQILHAKAHVLVALEGFFSTSFLENCWLYKFWNVRKLFFLLQYVPMLENLKWKKPKFDGSPGFSSNFEFSKQMQSKKSVILLY